MSRAGIKGKMGFPTLGPNPVTVEGGVAKLDIGKGAFALVDEADLPLVQTRRWYLDASGYASSTGVAGQRPVRMHRLILGVDKGDRAWGDHINHDKLDNRRENLRLSHGNGNVGNMVKPSSGLASKFKGVSKTRTPERWRAYIKIRRIQYGLGVFSTEEEAGAAYDAAAVVVFGKFALLNFPDTPPTLAEQSKAWRQINSARVPTSRFEGVSYLKKSRKWRAKIGGADLGVHDTEEDAAKAIEGHFLALRNVNTHPQLL